MYRVCSAAVQQILWRKLKVPLTLVCIPFLQFSSCYHATGDHQQRGHRAKAYNHNYWLISDTVQTAVSPMAIFIPL